MERDLPAGQFIFEVGDFGAIIGGLGGRSWLEFWRLWGMDSDDEVGLFVHTDQGIRSASGTVLSTLEDSEVWSVAVSNQVPGALIKGKFGLVKIPKRQLASLAVFLRSNQPVDFPSCQCVRQGGSHDRCPHCTHEPTTTT